MNLQEFAEEFETECTERLANSILKLKRFIEKASDQLARTTSPNGIYEMNDKPIEVEETPKTFRITDQHGRLSVVKKAEIEHLVVFRDNMILASGEVRSAMAKSHIATCKYRIRRAEELIDEMNLMEKIFGVCCTQNTVTMHERIVQRTDWLDEKLKGHEHRDRRESSQLV
jgi:hypothetical protein